MKAPNVSWIGSIARRLKRRPEPPNAPRRRRLLAIEDNEAFVQILRAILPRDEIRGEALFEGGLARLQRESFDVVVLDLTLPDSNAEQTIRRLGELRRTAGSARLVIVTASDDTPSPDGVTVVVQKGDPDWVEKFVSILKA